MIGTSEERDVEFIASLYEGGKISAADSLRFSMSSVKSALFEIPGLNVFRIPPCRLHLWDHGVFPRLLGWCIKIIETEGGVKGKREFDSRWTDTANYPGMVAFKQGVSDLKRLSTGIWRYNCHSHFTGSPPINQESWLLFDIWKVAAWWGSTN